MKPAVPPPRTTPPATPGVHRPGTEWPTWCLILAIYGAWLALILSYRQLPPLLANAALVVVVAWFMSLHKRFGHLAIDNCQLTTHN